MKISRKKFKTLRQWQKAIKQAHYTSKFRGGGRKRAIRLYRASPPSDDDYIEV